MNKPHYPTVRGLEALRAVRRELRERVADRDDEWLRRAARGAGIGIIVRNTGCDAVARLEEQQVYLNRHGELVKSEAHFTVVAMASDDSMRSAVSRLLKVHRDAVLLCATHGPRTLPAITLPDGVPPGIESHLG